MFKTFKFIEAKVERKLRELKSKFYIYKDSQTLLCYASFLRIEIIYHLPPL